MTVIALLVLIVLIPWLISSYNSFVRGSIQIKAAWSQIFVQLKRRHELIPNLVECVKGCMQYEQETLEKVIEDRNQALEAKDIHQSVTAENQLTESLRKLFVICERYPELKASTSMLKLQEEMSATENRVAAARQQYNDAILSFNTRCQCFPGNLLAKCFGFRPYEFFEISESETPEVKF